MLGLIRTRNCLPHAHRWSEQYFYSCNRFWFLKKLGGNFAVPFLGNRENSFRCCLGHNAHFGPMSLSHVLLRHSADTGNHTASAFFLHIRLPGSSGFHRFPEQLRFTARGKAKRSLVWNASVFSRARYFPGTASLGHGRPGGLQPILGSSFTEIAGESRSMPRARDSAHSQYRGEFINYFHMRK